MGLFTYHSIMAIVSFLLKPDIVLKLDIVNLLSMLPGIIMQSIGFYCAISCVKYGKVAITSSIKKCNTVVIFLLGIVLLQEEFTLLQIIVSAILIILSILLAKPKNGLTSIDRKLERKSNLYAYGYVLFNGISKIFNKVYVTSFEDPLYVLFNYAIIIMIGIFIYCLITKKWDYINIRKIKEKKYFLLQSFTDTSSSIFSRFSMLEGDISVISVINASSIVITILASRLLLKEKMSWKKYAMMVGIFVCVLILTLIK